MSRRYIDDPYMQGWYDWTGNMRSRGLLQIKREQWIEWWKATGVFEQRGRVKGSYRMRRIDISQPFHIGNLALERIGA